MDVTEQRLCLLLHSLTHTPPRALYRLLLHFGSPSAVWQSCDRRWAEFGLGAQAVEEFRRLRDQPGAAERDIGQQLAALAAVDAHILACSDRRYPVLLHTLYDPPPLLYLRGDAELLQRASLAVVGSRRGSAVGLRAAEAISAAASRAGLVICSGLALGIDGAAHRGALGAGGESVAVMATGIDRIYPHRHRSLGLALEKQGCLLTEFPPGVPPLPQNFPRRNRLISGLSLGVLVIEAALPSGSLITATTAMEQGREVFALPWSPFHRGGAGCLQLLRDGAKMVQRAEDILEELGPLYRLQQELFEPVCSKPERVLPPVQGRLLELLGYDVVSVDELVTHSGLALSQVLTGLSALELAGLIVQQAGGYQRNE